MPMLLEGGAVPRGHQEPRRRRATAMAAPVAAIGSAGAGLVHISDVPDLLWIWWAYAACVVAAGVLQVALAALLLVRRPPAAVSAGAIALNVGIVALYAIGQTRYGIPVGPLRGHVMTTGSIGVATTIAECVTVACLATLLPARMPAGQAVRARTRA